MSEQTQKHTPGPWWAIKPECERRKGVFASVCTNGATISTREFEIMADGYQNSHAEANARLIEAAPDLLAALKRVVALLPETAIAAYKAEEWEAAEQARAALAKAEGGEA